MKRLVCLAFVILSVPALAQSGRLQVGERVDHLIETAHPYGFADSETAQLVRTDAISHPGGTYIAVHFARFDLAPGEEQVFEVNLRRPPGRARLRVLPHVLGHGSFEELGGPVWEGEI